MNFSPNKILHSFTVTVKGVQLLWFVWWIKVLRYYICIFKCYRIIKIMFLCIKNGFITETNDLNYFKETKVRMLLGTFSNVQNSFHKACVYFKNCWTILCCDLQKTNIITVLQLKLTVIVFLTSLILPSANGFFGRWMCGY